MKERLRDLLSEVGERFASLRSAVRNLSRSMAELEEVVERSRTFATHATLSTPTDRAAIARLLKSTQKFLGHHPVSHQSGTEWPKKMGQLMLTFPQ